MQENYILLGRGYFLLITLTFETEIIVTKILVRKRYQKMENLMHNLKKFSILLY
jgi:hypothetical protein